MPSEDEITVSPVKLQKQGKYYKIAVPPNLIEQGLIDPSALYELKFKKIK